MSEENTLKFINTNIWDHIVSLIVEKCEGEIKDTQYVIKIRGGKVVQSWLFPSVHISQCESIKYDCSVCSYRKDKVCNPGNFLDTIIKNHKSEKAKSIISAYKRLDFNPHYYTKMRSETGKFHRLEFFIPLFNFLGFEDNADFEKSLQDARLKNKIKLYKKKSPKNNQLAETVPNIHYFSKTEWVVYHYNYVAKGRREINVGRLQFDDLSCCNNINIENYRGDERCFDPKNIEWYRGEIDLKYSNSNCIVANLELEDGHKYLQLRFWMSLRKPRYNDIILGRFSHIEEGEKLVTGSFVMQYLEEERLQAIPPRAYRTFGEKANNAQISKSIQGYLFDKYLNYSKTPYGINTTDSLKEWLDKKSHSPSFESFKHSGVYDVFFATPLSSLVNNASERRSRTGLDWDSYKKSVQDANIKLVDELEKHLMKKGIESIYYYPRVYQPETYKDLVDSSLNMKWEFHKIEMCRYFILFFPDIIESDQFVAPTSAFLELGYAISKRKTIFVICNTDKEKVLPFMLKAEGAHKLDIHISPSDRKLDDAKAIYRWIMSCL